MVKFIGMECAREALAAELHRQIKEDGCMCYECYIAHRTLARSVLRMTRTGLLVRMTNKDLRAFEAYRKRQRESYEKARKAMRRAERTDNGLSLSEKRSIRRGIADIRAGRVITKDEFLEKHPELK